MTASSADDLRRALEDISTHLKRLGDLMVLDAIGRLPDDSQKEKIRLLDSLDFSNAEISQLLGASESTIRKTRSRLRDE